MSNQYAPADPQSKSAKNTPLIAVSVIATVLAVTVAVLLAQIVTAKAQVAEAKAQMAELRAEMARTKLEAEQKVSESGRIATELQDQQLHASKSRLCIAQLKQLDSAKEQWLMDNKKPMSATPLMTDLVGSDKYILHLPRCPEGGEYVIGNGETEPSCTIHGTATNPLP